MKIIKWLEVDGARAPVPYSWRRQWLRNSLKPILISISLKTRKGGDLSPSISDAARLRSMTSPTVLATLCGECGILPGSRNIWFHSRKDTRIPILLYMALNYTWKQMLQLAHGRIMVPTGPKA